MKKGFRINFKFECVNFLFFKKFGSFLKLESNVIFAIFSVWCNLLNMLQFLTFYESSKNIFGFSFFFLHFCNKMHNTKTSLIWLHLTSMYFNCVHTIKYLNYNKIK